MDRNNIKTGVHIDLTTLLGAVDALKMIPETQRMPITFSHLLTLSQLFDSIVLHDKVYYEISDTPQIKPYDQVIQDSLIANILGHDILVGHQNPLVDDSFKYTGIVWAINNISKVSPESFAYSLLPRESHYRAVMHREGVPDTKNPHTKDIFETARREGDGKLAESIDSTLQYLEMNNIGRMGLHIMYRLFHFNEWLSIEKDLSYYPNYSRIPLVNDALVLRKRTRDFRYWALDEIKKKKEFLIADITDEEEIDDYVFKLSPIFIRCLKGAKHPLDLIENAMRLRDDIAVKKIRKLYKKLSKDSYHDEIELSIRQELRSALDSFNAHDVKNRSVTIALNSSISLSGFGVGISIKKTLTNNKKPSNIAFFIETLESSLFMVNALEAIEEVFGPVSLEDQRIMSARY